MPEAADIFEVYHVFLSSPGDMEQERDAVRLFFNSLNQSIAQPFGLRFDLIDWENCTNIGYQSPQDLITEQTLAKYSRSLALVIGLMGQRFGTPAGRFESGTQAEFEWAANHKRNHGHPEIKWFFRRIDHFVAPAEDVHKIRDAVEQWKKVKRFRKDYDGMYKEFASASTFPDVLREDLLRWFSTWIARKRALHGFEQQGPIPDSPEVPGFLDNRLSRTLRIVAALEDMLADAPQHGEPCIRICAVMSSFAITEKSSWAKREDEEYVQLLARERNLLEQLFEQRASLKMLLTWNVGEMADWERLGREDVLARLNRLREFCLKTLSDDGRVKRVQIVHTLVRERNLLILGDRCAFVGRKLGIKPGFEATEVILDKRRMDQEVQMFDILFNDAVHNEHKIRKPTGEADFNRQFLDSLIERIDRDIRTLRPIS